MREIVGQIDIRNFGYFGDGKNNDAPAFRAALAAMANFGSSKGAALVIPPSEAFIPEGETITIPAPMDGLTILGCGQATIIRIGNDNPSVNHTAFIVEDGSDAFFAGLVFKGPTTVSGGAVILAIEKQGTTGTLYLDSVGTINPANAGVLVRAGCRLEIGDCAEVGDDFTTPQGADITYTELGDALWGGTASHQPRQIKGEIDPSAGGGLNAPQGSIFQRYNVAGQLWLKTGAADTAWTQLSGGGPPASETLQDAYNAGGAGPQYIIEDGTRLGVIIRDATPSLGATATLFGMQDHAAANTYFAVNPSYVSSGVNGYRADAGLVKGFTDSNGLAGLQQANAGAALPDITVFGSPASSTTQSVGMASALALNSTRTDFVLWASGGLGVGFGTRTAGNLFQLIDNASTVKFQVDYLGSALVPQQAQAVGSPASAFVVSPGAHLALTASSQWSAMSVQGQTVTWATGNITTEPWVALSAPAFAFAAASTVTIASTLDVQPPVAGTNATFTGTYGITSGGAVRLGTSTHQDFPASVSIPAYYSVYQTTNKSSGIFFANETNNQTVGVQYDGAANALYVGAMKFSGGTGAPVSIIQPNAISISLVTTWDANGLVLFQPKNTTGAIGTPNFTWSDPGQTNLTSGLEHNSIYYNLGNGTKQFAAGAIATQRAYLIDPPTYAFVGASTIATAATLAVSGAPAAGTNATITTGYAFWAQAGLTALDGGMEMANCSPAVSAANTGRLLYNSGTQTFQVSLNGAAYVNIATGSTTETLQQAYNAGGGGTAGTITATAAGGQFSWTAGAASSGTPTDFLVTGAAHTGVTTTAEAVLINLNLAQTVTWATGNVALERAMRLQAPTIAAAGASTFTVATTLDISGPPTAGTNATLTNAYPMHIGSGTISIATAATSGWVSSGATFNNGMYVNSSGVSNVIALNGAGGEVVFFSGSDPSGFNHAGLAMVAATTDFRMYSNGAVRWSWVATTGAYTSQNTNAVISSADGSSGLYSYTFSSGGAGIFRESSGGISFGVNTSNTIHSWTNKGLQTILPVASTTGTPTGISYTDPANTGMTANTEIPSIKYDLSSIKTWATGALVQQRFVAILAPTVAFAGASTVQTAVTLDISGAPIAGTNATLTAAYALRAQGVTLITGAPDANSVNLYVASTTSSGSVIIRNSGNPSGGIELQSSTNNFIFSKDSVTLGFGTSGSSTAQVFQSDNTVTWAPSASITAPHNFWLHTGTNAPNRTASTEINDILWNLSGTTATWLTGTVATQRSWYYRAPTYAAAAASTFTVVATIAVSGAPVAGTNATFTNAYAAWFGAAIRVDGGTALGGGAAPTFGTIGGSGPTTAAQAEWIRIDTQNGKRWVPAWQ